MAKDLQTHCRESKQGQVEQLVQESSQHSARLTGLHRTLRKIAPKTTRRRMQLRESNRDLPDTKGHRPRRCGAYASPLAFQKLPNKALPRRYAPAPLWKLCAQKASELMVKDLRYLYQVTETQSVHWHQVEVVLLPKPSKPLSTPASLRPISLLPLYAEVLAQLVADALNPSLLRRRRLWVNSHTCLPDRLQMHWIGPWCTVRRYVLPARLPLSTSGSDIRAALATLVQVAKRLSQSTEPPYRLS